MFYIVIFRENSYKLGNCIKLFFLLDYFHITVCCNFSVFLISDFYVRKLREKKKITRFSTAVVLNVSLELHSI